MQWPAAEIIAGFLNIGVRIRRNACHCVALQINARHFQRVRSNRCNRANPISNHIRSYKSRLRNHVKNTPPLTDSPFQKINVENPDNSTTPALIMVTSSNEYKKVFPLP